jgi:hypothetical protein
VQKIAMLGPVDVITLLLLVKVFLQVAKILYQRKNAA